ncbi:maleylpyruvate isomerase N-terminal domain-containing protein [Mycolicibacterium sp.]|uniref:maleylpyruvate isomerase N-terminal domain-containing protein n=1 Tax=Mycolicibacterium sp. TaxID=2320850 RepID=UPI0037C8821C
MPTADPAYAWTLYRDTQQRIVDLMDDDAWDTRLPACPLWSVRDVVAHLAAVAEDWVSGTMTVPPTDAETAAQIARFEGHDTADVLAAWDSAAGQLQRLAADGTAPPLGDIVVHEHDIRGALGVPGARTDAAVWQVSDQLLDMLRTPVPVRVTVEDGEYRAGPRTGDEITLRTTRFEALRWRSGRRSHAQLAAMDWSADPAPVLEHLYLFGPAQADLVE